MLRRIVNQFQEIVIHLPSNSSTPASGVGRAEVYDSTMIFSFDETRCYGKWASHMYGEKKKALVALRSGGKAALRQA